MTFKIHSKLNRVVAVSVSLQELGAQIMRETAALKESEKILDLLTVHYMQTEMEYGDLIGETIDHTSEIIRLLTKHGQTKMKELNS